ncbi:FAD binding domain-containing protein [Aspergillus bertholletiae]|uniref:Fumarate reductase n=1 Tax=Aspergillus bertholletiae TaxID=1226010 RepID=A0A5N7BBN3_9EURO|nr:FAD binding domain-containing protein [Aspergillus bertholletiae]
MNLRSVQLLLHPVQNSIPRFFTTMTTSPYSLAASLTHPQPVIVVGSGLAGLSAATQLISHQVPVVMLDRAEKPGGNSIKASSGINGAPTKFQPEDVDDSQELFLTDTVKSAGDVFASSPAGEHKRRESLISTLTASSAEAVYWLSDEKGVDLSKVCRLGGHSRPRTHRGAGQQPPGISIVSTLLDSLKASSLFQLRSGARVTKVLREADEVLGVEYTGGERGEKEDNTTTTLNGPVVFASGGFAGDAHGLLAKYRPDLARIPSTNQAVEGTQPLLEGIGAGLVDMEQVQIHPTGFVDEKEPSAPVKILAAEALRGEGGILLLDNGNRFINELETREHITNVIMRSAKLLETDARQWDVNLLLDEGTAAALGSHMGFYLWKGLMRKTTVHELDPSMLETIKTYADIVSGKQQDEFGRTAFGNWILKDVTPDSVVYIGKVTPVTHFTMGGATIDQHSQVLDKDGAPIKGLWAAGEVTGGLHGQNRLGGSSLLECVVFGRIAGNEAAAFHKKHYTS